MPYLEPQDRVEFDQAIKALALDLQAGGNTVGQLNYVVSRLMMFRVLDKGKSYATLSETHAAVHDAAVEFERRVIGPYEDEKIEANGDVYSAIL